MLILYTLASFGSNYSPIIPIYVYVQASTKHYSTYVGELILSIRVCGTCLKSFTHGKIAWASNSNPFELNFHIFVELSSITKNGEIERSLFDFVN
jgi:hypothetical protein